MMSKCCIKKQTSVSLCIALMSIFSQIIIPLPFSVIPITLQTFAVILIGIILEERLASIVMSLYILLGCMGIPVFSGFSGGLHRIVGPTGGFIIGFIIMTFIIGRASRSSNKVILWIGVYLGLIIDYIMGAFQLSLVTHINFREAIVLGVYPFVAKDFILAAVAIRLASQIKVVLRKAI